VKVLLALLMAPADKLIARRALPSGGAKAQEGDQAVIGTDPIAQLRTGEGLEAKIVVAVNEFIPPAGIRAGADQPELQRGQGLHGQL
jgi:hypothetical protein